MGLNAFAGLPSETRPRASIPGRCNLTTSQTTYVYDFAQGNRDMKDLLGGKGANLAEMTNLGLPVPPGFTITTEACRAYLASGAEPPELAEQVGAHLAALEKAMGKQLGQSDDPLLVSVRSGAKFSMPGMMETVLNIGLNDQSVRGLASQAGNERFAFDSYRRLIQMFGKTVLGIDGEHFEHALDEAKEAKGTANDLDLDADDMRKLVETYKDVVVKHAGREFPQEPREQMDMAVRAVFDSWNTDRAVTYRRQERIPKDLGTAVNIVAMVFGNLDMASGTGVAFTRDPASGAQGIYGDYLQNAQGEDVVAGIRNTVPLADLEQIDKRSPTTSCSTSCERSRSTTATCATSSSRSSAASCGCCRPGSASAPRVRRSGSPPSSSTRACSTWTRRSSGSPARSWRS